MNEEIKHISINDIMSRVSETEANVMTPDIMLVMDSDKVGRQVAEIGQPYQLQEGRLVRVVSGTARMVANLRTVELAAQSVGILPPGAIIQYEYVSDDFHIEAFSYTTMPAALAFDGVTVLRLGEIDFLRMGDYLRLMMQVLRKNSYSLRTLQLLQMALFNDLHNIQTVVSDAQPDAQPTRQEQTFNLFIDLVNEFGTHERRIQFYADRLLLSPNRLSTLIKDYSGRTVMQWVNQATLLQAKVLLKHCDLMIFEIADRLGFNEATAFNRYFKRETGMTPLAYRNLLQSRGLHVENVAWKEK